MRGISRTYWSPSGFPKFSGTQTQLFLLLFQILFMIDVHCHLEHHDFDVDRKDVIEKLKNEIKAVITVCTHQSDFGKTVKLVEENPNFVFASVGYHPGYIKEVKEKDIEELMEKIKENKERIVSVGEVGLDNFWIKEKSWQEKQKEMFIDFINFAKEIDKPLTVHSRDAYEDVVKILEQEDAKRVHLHLFGANQLVKEVSENGWYISIGPIVLRSKKHFQIARDMPLELLLLETDSPWNAPEVFLEGKKVRNIPSNVKFVAQKVAEIKKISVEEVEKKTDENAIDLFNLSFK